MKMFNILII